MSPDDPADDIRQRMAELRRELASDVQEVSRSAREMTDPKFYLRRFPWAMAGAAVAVGFLLVPKKKREIIQPDAETVAELIRQKKIHIEPMDSQKKDSLIKTLMLMGVTWAAKAGAGYMTQQLSSAAFNRGKNTQDQSAELPPGPSPLQQPWQS